MEHDLEAELEYTDKAYLGEILLSAGITISDMT